ncbi:MAG: MltA domain-containing protein [Delftia acidovorans]|jgi:membrane-bound lytic murein transglycosylase A|nr:MltA domain-containing protein [Delftia acidovorans]MDR3014438.1 MltA domain-containing protein [Delftia acidovorans]
MNFHLLRHAAMALIVGTLVACTTTTKPVYDPSPVPDLQPGGPVTVTPRPPLVTNTPTKSRWIAADWSELPGLQEDALHEAWNAWLKNCERPSSVFAGLCRDVRQLSIATGDEQRAWLMANLQPYRIEALGGGPDGMLTAYYEPLFEARRLPGDGFNVPLYKTPAGAGFGSRKPWFSRQQIETMPEAQAALAGRAIAWMRDPVDAMVLHIQGSGRLNITEPTGAQRTIRVAFAGTNDHPYKSVGRWLLDQGLVRDATWPGISAWVAANPGRVNEMLWSNPRYVFFREEPLEGLDLQFGPKGAQGVALTPGRSIAVDKQSIPYGTPVWLSTSGPTVALNRLVFAQDTGSAIVGAVRADYFMGWGPEAGDLAGRIKQNLRLWAFWPRSLASQAPHLK